MRDFVITIPVDENLEDFLKQFGYELLTRRVEIVEVLTSGELPDLQWIGNEDEGIDYPFDLELTADKPVAGQRVGDSHDRELAEITLNYASQEFVNPLMLPKDSGIDIPQLEVMG
jgi:hypothetical protein